MSGKPVNGNPVTSNPMSKGSVRAALVMNGGVSLAVWMGGVTHELNRFRTSSGVDSPAWRAIRQHSYADVDVDLVAGTSAGGLNGTLLATSIARQAPLPDLLDVWVSRGRLTPGSLLPDTPAEQPPQSVLDGDAFTDALGTVLTSMATSTPTDRIAITLLVTATALSGGVIPVRDGAGAEFSAGDHRRVYRFRRRDTQWRWHDGHVVARKQGTDPEFNTWANEFESNAPSLQLAARASAGFPFAFAPVQETPELFGLDIQDVAGKALSWLVDGGVLDNAPFGPVLAELTHKPLHLDATRWLLYVVPSADPPTAADPIGAGAMAPPWSQLPGRLLGLFREADMRSDAEELKDYLEQSAENQVRPEVLLGTSGQHEAIIDAAKGFYGFYQRTRAAESVRSLANGPLDAASSTTNVTRLLNAEPWWIPTEFTAAEPSGEWCWGVSTAQRLVTWMGRHLRTLPQPSGNLELPISEALGRLANIEEQLAAWASGVDSARMGVKSGTPELADRIDAMVGWEFAGQLKSEVAKLVAAAVETWGRCTGVPDDPAARASAYELLLAIEVLMKAFSWAGAEDPPPRFTFYRIGPDYPFEWIPNHLKSQPGWGSRKLYGTSFGHFGAFGLDEWKNSDWLWGRLDGAASLARAALSGCDPSERERLVDDLIDEIITEVRGKSTDPQQVRDELAREVARMMKTTNRELLTTYSDSEGGRQSLHLMIDRAALMLSGQIKPPDPDASFFTRLKAKGKRFALRRGLAIAVWFGNRSLPR